MPDPEPKLFDAELAPVAWEVASRQWPCRRATKSKIVFLARLDDGHSEKVYVTASPLPEAPSSRELGLRKRARASVVTVKIGLVNHLVLTPDLLATAADPKFRLATGKVVLEPHEPGDSTFSEFQTPVRASLEFQFLGAFMSAKAVIGAALDMAESARSVRSLIMEPHGGTRDGNGIGRPYVTQLTLDPEQFGRDRTEAPVGPNPEVDPLPAEPALAVGDVDLPTGLVTLDNWTAADALRRGFGEANPLVLAQVLAKRQSMVLRHRLGAEGMSRLVALDAESTAGSSLVEHGPLKVHSLLRQVDLNTDEWSLWLNKVADTLLTRHPEILELVGVDPDEAGQRGPRSRRPKQMSAETPRPPVPDANPDDAKALPAKALVRSVLPKAELIKRLKARVKGQDHVVEPVASRIVMARKGLAGSSKSKPDGVFLFAGPTGVGKTELAKAIADTVYGKSDDNMIRIDCSELYDKWAISRLTGSNPGYIGFDQPEGWLTTKIIKNPNSVLLLDEFEKAAPEVWMAFLQVFDEGRMTDGRGQTADFSRTIVVLTSNVGSSTFTKRDVGFGKSDELDLNDFNKTRSREVMTAVRKALPPELFNRLDQTLVFNAMSTELLSEIAETKLKQVVTDLAEVGYDIDVKPGLAELVARLDWDPALGARPLNRTIDRVVREPLADLEAGKYSASPDGDRVVYEPLPKPE